MQQHLLWRLEALHCGAQAIDGLAGLNDAGLTREHAMRRELQPGSRERRFQSTRRAGEHDVGQIGWTIADGGREVADRAGDLHMRSRGWPAASKMDGKLCVV